MNGLTVEEKFAKIIIDLRRKRPFYAAVYEAMPKIKTDAIETCGVTSSEFKYNESFVAETPYDEFVFVMLHEIAHLSLMHCLRGKDCEFWKLWNIACDFYVNRLVQLEFKLSVGIKDLVNGITFPSDALYNERTDIDEESAETIYRQLEKQAHLNGYDTGNPGVYEFNYKSAGGKTVSFKTEIEANSSSSEDGHGKSGKSLENDLLPDSRDKIQQDNDARAILRNAVTRNEMMQSTNSAGDSAGELEFQVKEALKSKLDWKKLLRKYCIKHRAQDASFASPDKRMYYQEAIYPGTYLDDNGSIKNAKICIDTSGSISDTDIQYILGQARSLLKQFKTDAELICWDTTIESTSDLAEGSQIQGNIKFVGRGGTSPSCLFEYFDSKKCKIKPFIVLVFTDGYFYSGVLERNIKWKKRYKRTIWVMTRNYDKQFNPPFGVVAYAKYPD